MLETDDVVVAGKEGLGVGVAVRLMVEQIDSHSVEGGGGGTWKFVNTDNGFDSFLALSSVDDGVRSMPCSKFIRSTLFEGMGSQTTLSPVDVDVVSKFVACTCWRC